MEWVAELSMRDARKAVDEILSELGDRRFPDIESFDEGIQKEIREALLEIIRKNGK